MYKLEESHSSHSNHSIFIWARMVIVSATLISPRWHNCGAMHKTPKQHRTDRPSVEPSASTIYNKLGSLCLLMYTYHVSFGHHEAFRGRFAETHAETHTMRHDSNDTHQPHPLTIAVYKAVGQCTGYSSTKFSAPARYLAR